MTITRRVSGEASSTQTERVANKPINQLGSAVDTWGASWGAASPWGQTWYYITPEIVPDGLVRRVSGAITENFTKRI